MRRNENGWQTFKCLDVHIILMKGRYKFRIVNIRVYFTIHKCHMSMDKDRYGGYRLRVMIKLKGQEKGWI